MERLRGKSRNCACMGHACNAHPEKPQSRPENERMGLHTPCSKTPERQTEYMSTKSGNRHCGLFPSTISPATTHFRRLQETSNIVASLSTGCIAFFTVRASQILCRLEKRKLKRAFECRHNAAICSLGSCPCDTASDQIGCFASSTAHQLAKSTGTMSIVRVARYPQYA